MKLVIFDVDGTLIDSQAHILGAMARAFEAQGRPAPERADVLSIIGLSLPIAMEHLAPDGDAALWSALDQSYRDAFAAMRQADAQKLAPLYPGARAALDALSAREDMVLAIATGKSKRGMDHMADLHGFEGLFASVQTADGHPSKPHPSMIEACLSDTGLNKADAIMIGDTIFDMDMAANAGVVGLGVNWGYHPSQALTEAGARDVLTEFDALIPWLEKHWNIL